MWFPLLRDHVFKIYRKDDFIANHTCTIPFAIFEFPAVVNLGYVRAPGYRLIINEINDVSRDWMRVNDSLESFSNCILKCM